MRIAYLCCDRGVPVDGTKGAAIHVRSVAGALARRGHDLTLFAARPGDAADSGGTSPDLSAAVVDVGYDRTAKEARNRMPEGSAEAAEAYALLLNARAAEALAEHHRRAPFDAVYERYSLWSLAGVRFARDYGVPLVLEVNAPLVEEAQAYRHLHLVGAAAGIERAVLAGADQIVVPAAELRSWIAREVGRESGVHVFPNAVDGRLFQDPQPLPSEHTGIPAGAFVVAFVGSLKPWHGVESLLTAFETLAERVPESHLLVLGDGPLREVVDAAARRLPGRITAPGAVGHEDVPAWLAAADVGVAPYPQLDSFYFSPLKLVEYQAAGLAVVASAIGQIARHLDHGRTGLLTPPGDSVALARALIKLARDPAATRRMGRRGRRRVLASATWDRVAERLETVFRRAGVAAPATAPTRVAAGGRP